MKKLNKYLKRSIFSLVLLLGLFIFTSCTKSFVNTSDNASLYGAYAKENIDTIKKNATTNNIILPDDKFFEFIDQKIEGDYQKLITDNTLENQDTYNNSDFSYIPFDMYTSHKNEYLTDTTDSEEVKLEKGYVSTTTIKYLIEFTGKDADNKQTLWANYDKWVDDYTTNNPNTSPSKMFVDYYKNSIATGVGQVRTGLTPVSGYFGINKDTYVQGKTWGQAFSEYGFLEGLLVYPIGWLLYTFTTAFGVGGWGQVGAICLVTLIARSIIVLFSIGSYSTQYKMAELQPKIQMLQAKYPNVATDQNQKMQFSQEQMKLYKQNKIHPFRSMLVLIVQFPLFLCVWGALQGSAILTQGNVLGLQLSTVSWTAIQQGGSEAPLAIVLLILMAIAQFFATLLPQWMQNWRKSKIVGAKTVKVQDNPQMGMMKYMPWIMLIVVIIMSFQLPAAMGIYWFVGALISILQTIITEIIRSCSKGRKPRNKDKYTSYKKVDKKHMKIR